MTGSDSISRDELLHVSFAFGEALSSIPTHNHLNGAYHEANMYWSAPPQALMWRIPAIGVPAKVRRAVRSEVLIAGVKQTIEQARRAIEQIRPHLDHETECTIHYSPDHSRPDQNLHDSVVATHRLSPGYAPAWCYKFNPYLLAIALLDEYEQRIDKVMKSRLVPFTQVSRIHQKAKELEINVDLVRGQLW